MDVKQILIDEANTLLAWKLRCYEAEARVKELENQLDADTAD